MALVKSKLVFYFHGYGSSPQTDKVKMLKEHFEFVYAFPIDENPKISLPFLEKEIDKVLVQFPPNGMHDPKPVFVGTSLGAWYAGKMAEKYNVASVLINPAYSFESIKIPLEWTNEVKEEYLRLGFRKENFHLIPKAKYFIARKDEVIDFSPIEKILNSGNTRWTNKGGHRFNGPEFENVIDYIKLMDDHLS